MAAPDAVMPSAPPDAVALFGTSADPPTEGHRVLLEGLLERYPRVATWASDNPSKRHGAPLELRARLLAELVAAIGDPRLSLEQELSSPWAIETLERAGRRWPRQPLVFVVGSDLLAQIPRWREARSVLERCRLAVAPRRGWPLQESALARLRLLGCEPDLLDLVVPETASSRVRAGVAAAEEGAQGIPGAVMADPEADAEGIGGESGRGSEARPAAAVLREVPQALWPLLLQHNLYGLAGQRPQIPPTSDRR